MTRQVTSVSTILDFFEEVASNNEVHEEVLGMYLFDHNFIRIDK